MLKSDTEKAVEYGLGAAYRSFNTKATTVSPVTVTGYDSSRRGLCRETQVNLGW